MKSGFMLSVPRAPGSFENPTIDQIEVALRNEDFWDGSLADVSLTYFEINDPEPRVHRKLFFWIDSSGRIAPFYEGKGAWWGFSDQNKKGDDVEVDDGGGNDILLNSRFLQPIESVLILCAEMLEAGAVEIADGWEKVTYRYLG